MIYILGTPGQRPRLNTFTPEEAAALLATGEVTLTADAPGEYVISADGTALEPYVYPIADARDRRWADALAYRDAKATAGCSTPSGTVQTDDDSQRKINGAATAALIAKSTSQAFSLDWTMADNSVVAMDADAVIAMGMAVVAYLNACQNAGTAIRNQINSAADASALAAIDITAGYPS